MWLFFSRALSLSPLCLNVYAINHKAPTTKKLYFRSCSRSQKWYSRKFSVHKIELTESYAWNVVTLAIQILVSINLIIIAFLIEKSEHSCVTIIAMIAFMLTRLALRITYEMNYIIHSTTIHKYISSGHMCACFGHRLLIMLFSCLSTFINSNA